MAGSLNTGIAWTYHEPTNRLIEKPPGRGAKWARDGNCILYMWANEQVSNEKEYTSEEYKKILKNQEKL